MTEYGTALCDLTRNLVRVPENRVRRKLIATSASCRDAIAIAAAGGSCPTPSSSHTSS